MSALNSSTLWGNHSKESRICLSYIKPFIWNYVLNYNLKSNKTSIAVIFYEINDWKGIFIIISSQHKCCHQI
jgi:hypothetical protein